MHVKELKFDTLRLMVRCLYAISLEELESLRGYDLELLRCTIQKLACDRTGDPIKGLWRDEAQFESYFADLSPLLIPMLDDHLQYQQLLYLLDGTIVRDKEAIKTRATYILYVSLFNIELSGKDPLLVAAAAYYAAVLTIGTVPWVS